MNVLFFGYEYPPLGGGVGNAIKHLFEEYSKFDDLQIDFVTTSIDNNYKVEKKYKNITFYHIPIGERTPEDYHKQKPKDMVLYIIKSYFLTWRLIFRKKYDLIHFFGYPGGVVPLLFRWKIPYIISLRGVDVPGYNDRFKKIYFIYKPLSKIIWRFAYKVVANSQGLADLAKETAPKQKFKVIPNGVDTKSFYPVSDNEKYHKFSITAGGTLFGAKKGLKYLISGFAKFNKKHPDTRLVLIGSGDLEEELKKQVKKLNIQNSVEFIGRKSHKWIQKNLPKFHVFCLPSINEGMSNAALEALSSGLPLILTDTGGTKEILTEGENGYTVPKKNTDEISIKIENLYLQPNLRKTFGDASRKKAENMNWNKVAIEYMIIYQKVSKL